MLLNCAGEDSWESLGQQDQTIQPARKSTLNIHCKDRCWSSNTLATWCKEPTHWERPWCWERLRTGGEGDDRGWDGWTASVTQGTWVWAHSGRWWRTGEWRSLTLSLYYRPWVLKESTQVSDWTTTRTKKQLDAMSAGLGFTVGLKDRIALPEFGQSCIKCHSHM